MDASAAYRRDGWYRSVVEGAESSGDSGAWAGTAVEKALLAHTQVFGSVDQCISDAEMRSIPAQTMVMAGDASAGASRAGVPAARLVILPTTPVGVF